MEKNQELLEIISALLLKGYEGGYWDYKSDYPATSEDKLHDIICMANNLEDRDAYLIYGANDDGTVCGIENSSKRCVTADVIKFLRDKNFAGGFIPQVEMHTLKIDGHEIDVLVILRGNHTPYYLQNDFGKDPQHSKRIRAGAIYTRTADMNTPRDKTASIEHTEYLWRKHFGYDLRPAQRFELLLEDYAGWSETNWDNCRQSYHKDYPEYRIVVGESKDAVETISYFYDDESMPWAKLSLEYFSTVLYETELWYMDLGRCIIPKPKWRFMIGKGLYYYFLKDSINGRLLGLFTKGEYRCNNRCGIEMPIMIFEHDRERKSFEEWFLGVDRELKKNIQLKIEDDAIMQHIAGKEERDGKPELGVKDVALAFALYKRWRKIRNFTEE